MNKWIYSVVICFAITSTARSEGEHDHAGHDHSGHDHAVEASATEEHAGEDHNHADEEQLATPNGGKLIEKDDVHLELLVTDERKIQFTILNEKHEAIQPEESYTFIMMTGDRANPTTLAFTKNEQGAYLSTEALPEGNGLPAVVRYKKSADERLTTLAKLNLNLSDCPACNKKEYACSCIH